jgi:hypothetical protein
MIAAIHQPNFSPWSGYFSKIKSSNVFIFFDDVQFPRAKTFGNRVYIRTHSGEQWLTIPVIGKGDLGKFCEIRIDNSQNWQRKMIKTIELAYKKSPYFDMYYKEITYLLSQKNDFLSNYNINIITQLSKLLKIETKFLQSSLLHENSEFENTEKKIIDLIRFAGCNEYLSGKGTGSARYINEEDFNRENIKLYWQEYTELPYKQQWGQNFIPKLSIIDLMFNIGPYTSNYFDNANHQIINI